MNYFALCLVAVTLLHARADAQWEWRNPRPQGNDLWGVAFAPSSTAGWAVGGAGIIVATGDGGSTWSVQESGSDTFLRGVFACTATRAWAVGDDGTVLLTTDGGSSWNPQASGSSEGINQLYATTASEAWFVGDAGIIGHTVNGGGVWSAQTSGSSNNLNDICFTTASTGFCVGAAKTILRTSNGGSTWSTVTLSGPGQFDLIGVFFLNQNLGWAAGTFGTIMRTTNGGALWTRSVGVGTTADLNDVLFLDASNGYACGEDGTLLKSTNGGVSWTSVAISSNGLEAIGAAGSMIASVGVYGDVLRSTGGAFSNILTGSRSTFNAVATAGSQRVWMAGDAGAIFASTDAGFTWTQQAAGMVAASLYGATAVDAQHAWICGAGGLILRTTNGGSNWILQSSGQSVALNGIDFPSPTIGFAVGLSGKIIRTSNGGTTWSAVPSGTLDDLNGIDMLTDSIGVVVGANGVVLHTTNSGTSWQRQSSYTLDALFSVVLSADNGWICGDAGIILYTTDAGQNWDAASTNQTSPLFDLVQSSPNDLAAVGEDGLILRSTDAGLTWTQERSHAMYTLYSIAIGGGVLRAAGDFGMSLSNGGYPTPVTLVSFTGRAEHGVVHLAWETSGERNNAGFEVQRRQRAAWLPVAFVTAARDQEKQVRYSYDDAFPAGPVLRYRLRQIDTDGSSVVGPELELAIGNAGTGFALDQNFPNPARGGTAIRVVVPLGPGAVELNGVQLLLHDAAGRLLADLTPLLRSAAMNADADGSTTLFLSEDVFPQPGAYFCTLRAPALSITRLMLILR